MIQMIVFVFGLFSEETCSLICCSLIPCVLFSLYELMVFDKFSFSLFDVCASVCAKPFGSKIKSQFGQINIKNMNFGLFSCQTHFLSASMNEFRSELFEISYNAKRNFHSLDGFHLKIINLFDQRFPMVHRFSTRTKTDLVNHTRQLITFRQHLEVNRISEEF